MVKNKTRPEHKRNRNRMATVATATTVLIMALAGCTNTTAGPTGTSFKPVDTQTPEPTGPAKELGSHDTDPNLSFNENNGGAIVPHPEYKNEIPNELGGSCATIPAGAIEVLKRLPGPDDAQTVMEGPLEGQTEFVKHYFNGDFDGGRMLVQDIALEAYLDPCKFRFEDNGDFSLQLMWPKYNNKISTIAGRVDGDKITLGVDNVDPKGYWPNGNTRAEFMDASERFARWRT